MGARSDWIFISIFYWNQLLTHSVSPSSSSTIYLSVALLWDRFGPETLCVHFYFGIFEKSSTDVFLHFLYDKLINVSFQLWRIPVAALPVWSCTSCWGSGQPDGFIPVGSSQNIVLDRIPDRWTGRYDDHHVTRGTMSAMFVFSSSVARCAGPSHYWALPLSTLSRSWRRRLYQN